MENSKKHPQRFTGKDRCRAVGYQIDDFVFFHPRAAGDAGSSEESKVAIEIESLDAQASVDFFESRHEQASKSAGWHLIGRTSDAHMFQNGFFQEAL